MVLADRGYELESQLERLSGYLSEPPGALTIAANTIAANTTTAAAAAAQDSGNDSGSGSKRTGAPPGKEDIDAHSSALEHGYHGPVLDAFLGSDEEGGTPRRHRRDDDASGGSGSGGDGGDGGGGGGDDDHDEGLAAVALETSSDSVEEGRNVGEEILDRDGGVILEPMPLPSDNPTETAGNSTPSVASGTAEAASPAAAARAAAAPEVAGAGAANSATEAETGERRGGRARALMTAPGVDAASGVRGWRRRRVKAGGGGGGGGGGGEGAGDDHDEGDAGNKVTVVQDVLSVLFGWDVPKRSRGGAGGGGRGLNSGNGVMFA